MPMNAYTGATGSGKTIQVMEHVICKEIAQGRSIVTNIENVDLEGIYVYILCKHRDEKETVRLKNGDIYTRPKIVCLGSLRLIPNEIIENSGDDLFPRIEYVDGKTLYLDTDSVVKNGELVIVDEAANWWGDGTRIPKRHDQFFREHRHFVNPLTLESCDIVFIVQDVAYLARSLRRKGGIRYTFWIEKLDLVGLTRRYKMLMYSGSTITARTKPERIEHGEYKEEVYLLYDSYAGGKGKEKIMDSRQNVLNNPKKWKFIGVGILIFLIIAFFAVRSLIRYFSPKPSGSVVSTKPADSSSVSVAKMPETSDYRVTGWYRSGNFTYVVVRSSAGAVRTLISPANWVLSPIHYSGKLDDKFATEWSGSEPDQKKGLIK